ncbi:MAG: hypothetical protein N2Z74_10445, partial [Syntrophales bacterium]|nr:hypothetical protein [Syntrophales bacterium]
VLSMDVPRHPQFYTPENWGLFNSFLRALADLFREGQEAGIYRREVSPMMASFFIYGAIDNTIRQYVYNPEFNEDDFPIGRAVAEIMNIIKRGFSTQEG